MKSTVVIFAVAFLATASASCPNDCSGHGACGVDEHCACDRNRGQTPSDDYMYFEPDCSKRTCAKGRSWGALSTDTISLTVPMFYPNRGASVSSSQNFLQVLGDSVSRQKKTDLDIEILILESGAAGWFAWKYATDATFGTPFQISNYDSYDEMLHLSQAAGEETGVYIWFDESKSAGTFNLNLAKGDMYTFTSKYNFGIEYNHGDANTAHQFAECSGVGVCNYASGSCECPAPYTGSACQRKLCPNSCSGHGQCMSLSNFLKDVSGAAASYDDAWDASAESMCLCDDGFRGADCSQIECPSGKDPLLGFGGDGRNGYHSGSGSDPSNEGPALDCSGRGSCDYSTGVCECDTGYYGSRCEWQTNFV